MGDREHEESGIQYHEVVHGAPDDAELPMIVSFHGRGGTPHVPDGSFYGVSRPVRLIVPRGPARVGEGYAWYDAGLASGADRIAAELTAATARIAAFVERVRARHPTAGAPIATGFSQGGMLTLALALRHPELLRAAFPVAAWIPDALVPDELARHQVLIRMMHGAADEVVPSEPTVRLVDRLRGAGWDIELRTYESVAHDTSAVMTAQLHQWLEESLG